jgi:hypothetical protein
MPYWIVWGKCGCRGSSKRQIDQVWSTRIVFAALLPDRDQNRIKTPEPTQTYNNPLDLRLPQ